MRVAVVLLMVLVALIPSASSARLRDFRYMTKNISSTLDQLLAVGRYDKRIRPDLGGPSTLVTVSVYIKSMSSVSETEQKYSMDTYFRQSWFDRRLRFSLPGIDEFSMSWLFMDRLWKPDTFIVNGHRSYLHRITVPNKFARVRSDGFITYSMRLTLQASCPMHLRKFPLDSQRCPLLIGSYGYTSSEIEYAWHPTTVGLEPGVELAQYELVNITTVPAQLIRRGSEEYSMISATFHLRRNTGYYTLQVFVPCGLIVCSSWVSFWIDPDAVPARVSLAVTTVLSMTTMGFSGRAAMPRVNYATALDWFVILCFAFVFAVMLEYAAINFIDKVTVDLRRILEERKKKKNSTADDTTEPAVDTTPDSTAATNAVNTIGTPRAASHRSRSSSVDNTIRGHGSAGAPRLAKRRSVPGPQRRASHLDVDGIYADVSVSTPVGDSEEPQAVKPQYRVTAERSSLGRVAPPPPTTPPPPPRVPPVVVVTRDAPAYQSVARRPCGPAEDEILYADASPGTSIGNTRTVDSSTQTVNAEDEASSNDYVIPIELTAEVQPPASSGSGTGTFLSVPGLETRPGSPFRRTQSLRRCLSAPYRLWEQTRFLPSEEDVSRQMQSDVEPEKFTKIDIVSRKVFPIAFGSMILFYWIMYGYYISDYFPGEEDKVVLYDLARPRSQNKN